MNPYLLTVMAAAAYRFVLGSDVGIEYNTNALSSHLVDQFTSEPLPRTPWAFEVRPDILFALFNSQHYGYLQGDGGFSQPFALTVDDGDNPEGVGNLTLGGRFRLGRRVIFHPGAFVRIASSNSFVQSQDEVATGQVIGRPFTALYGGGWLELEVPIGSRLRLLFRGDIEAWDLESDEASPFFIPAGPRSVQPNLSIETLATAWLELSRRNGLAIEVGFEDGFFFREGRTVRVDDPEEGEPDEIPQTEDEQQYTLTGRLVYRRAWLPTLLTDFSIGLIGLQPRNSELAEPNPGEWILAGGWQINFVGGVALTYFGRPRWLTLRVSYERSYEQLDFRNLGSALDAVNLLVALGPFDGLAIALILSWSRFPVEVDRLPHNEEDNTCPANPDPDVPIYQDSWTRPFDTIGLTVDLRYMFERGGLLFGPFFEGYVYTQLGEGYNNTGQQPHVENVDCYVPPNLDPLEALLTLGFRLQWGTGTARSPRQGQDVGGATEGSRAERRLALQRMTREERLVPGFAYRPSSFGTDDEGASSLFGDDDPLGRMGSDPMFHDYRDLDDEDLRDGEEEDDDLNEDVEREEQQWDAFSDRPEENSREAPTEEPPMEEDPAE